MHLLSFELQEEPGLQLGKGVGLGVGFGLGFWGMELVAGPKRQAQGQGRFSGTACGELKPKKLHRMLSNGSEFCMLMVHQTAVPGIWGQQDGLN